MTVPGIVLSQAHRQITASKKWPSATSSMLSAMTSRETRLVLMPDVPIVIRRSGHNVAPASRWKRIPSWRSQ